MIKKIEEKLYKIWLFREEANKGSTTYSIRSARLIGAVDLLKLMGYEVEFNPSTKNENPFRVEKKK